MKKLFLTLLLATFCASSFGFSTITEIPQLSEQKDSEEFWSCVSVWLRTECDFQGINCYDVYQVVCSNYQL